MLRRDYYGAGRMLAWAIVAALAVLPLAGCGDDHRREIEALVQGAMAAFQAGDAHTLCKTLSPAGKEAIGRSGHRAPPLECPADIQGFLAAIDRYRGGDPPHVEDVTTEGDKGDARLRLPDGTEAIIPLSKRDGRWRLDGLTDARLSYYMTVGTPRAEQLLAPTAAPARADGGSATVRDARADGDPCPGADMSEYPLINSRCAVVVVGRELKVRAWTAFGVWRLAECDIVLEASFDGPGRAWITQFRITGTSVCTDFRRCRDEERRAVPWAATADAGPGGTIRLHIPDACLDTCVGLFEGGWDIELAGGAEGWRGRFASPLGSTGLRIDGPLRGRGRALTVDH